MRVVNRDEQGVVLRGRMGLDGRTVRVQGRNAGGEVVVHDCDQGGRDIDPPVVSVLPAGHPWVAKRRGRVA